RRPLRDDEVFCANAVAAASTEPMISGSSRMRSGLFMDLKSPQDDVEIEVDKKPRTDLPVIGQYRFGVDCSGCRRGDRDPVGAHSLNNSCTAVDDETVTARDDLAALHHRGPAAK